MLPAQIVALAFFVVALGYALLLCRRTHCKSIPLVLITSWLAHGAIYYTVQATITLVYCCPYPDNIILLVSWWSIVLRFWILVPILFILALAFYKRGSILYEH